MAVSQHRWREGERTPPLSPAIERNSKVVNFALIAPDFITWPPLTARRKLRLASASPGLPLALTEVSVPPKPGSEGGAEGETWSNRGQHEVVGEKRRGALYSEYCCVPGISPGVAR